MTAVAAPNAGHPIPAAWPLPSAYVRAASRADFRQLLAREEASVAKEGEPGVATAFLAAVLTPKAPPAATSAAATAHGSAPATTRQSAADDDVLDPLHRHRAALAPPNAPSTASSLALPSPLAPAFGPATVAAPEAAPRALASLEHLVPALVRRIAWSGDARRGTARLEIGAGVLAGSTLLVHADEGQVRVQLSVPPGIDAVSWQRRIAERLASRNIAAESVEVA